jgi:hypothetical protein
MIRSKGVDVALALDALELGIAGKIDGEFQLYNGIMLGVVKIDYVKCQKPALNADIKTSSSMDSFSRNRDIVAGRRKHSKDLIAPMLFDGSLDAVTFERWLEVH